MKRKMINKYLLVLTGAMLLGGCGKTEPADIKTTDIKTTDIEATETVADVQADEAVNIAIADIYAEITNNVELISPVCFDEDFIYNYYAIDPESLEEYVFSMSEDATSAETVIIMNAKDSAMVSDISDCLQMVVDEKKNEMENYLPEQFEIVSKSSVQTEGNYIWLVISKNADTINEIIESSIK